MALELGEIDGRAILRPSEPSRRCDFVCDERSPDWGATG